MIFLLALALPLAALAEESAPATQTDLGCLHEHRGSVIYFFDSPQYISISAASHRVFGPAVVETVCLDCGETLSADTVSNAEEIRPHTIKKGVCPLCGYRQKLTAGELRQDAPGERTLVAQPDGSGLLLLTLTEQDLTALDRAKVDTVLVRGVEGRAVIALDVQDALKESGKKEAPLSLEMAEQEDGSLFASLMFTGVRKVAPETGFATLRFYVEKSSGLRIAVTEPDGSDLTEEAATWQEAGYWYVPYLREGDYILVR